MISLAHYVGLDLGQAQDPTALVLLERPRLSVQEMVKNGRPIYALRHLQRFQLGTPYPAIVERVAQMLAAGPIVSAGIPTLVVDGTGVGRAVVDMFRDRLKNRVTCKMMAVTITGGHVVKSGSTGGMNVPKKELVGAVQVLLQSRRLLIAKSLADAVLLVKELENFRVKVTAAANETFEAWREGLHDDLVLAVALAAWKGEIDLPKVPSGKGRVRERIVT